ncbi:hypothetical protein GQ457_14G002880 [Hibiscus cannabinus]
MRRCKFRLGTRSLVLRTCIVAGQVLLPSSSQRWMLVRSYVTPVHKLTGDFIRSNDIGHRKRLGTKMREKRKVSEEKKEKVGEAQGKV